MNEYELVKTWESCRLICRSLGWRITFDDDHKSYVVFNREPRYVTQFDGVRAMKQYLDNRWASYLKNKKQADPIIGG